MLYPRLVLRLGTPGERCGGLIIGVVVGLIVGCHLCALVSG